MTPEARVKQSVKKLLATYGGQLWYFMPVGGMLGRAGIPDFIGCYKGKFFGIETKAGRGKPTALQELCMNEIQAAGGRCLVVNEKNIQYLPEWLEQL